MPGQVWKGAASAQPEHDEPISPAYKADRLGYWDRGLLWSKSTPSQSCTLHVQEDDGSAPRSADNGTCRTIVWDVSAGVELAELPPSGNWNFAAAWSPTNPGVFATASFDGKVPASLLPSIGIAVMSGTNMLGTPTRRR